MGGQWEPPLPREFQLLEKADGLRRHVAELRQRTGERYEQDQDPDDMSVEITAVEEQWAIINLIEARASSASAIIPRVSHRRDA
jgi:hypothetical protein